MRRRPPVRTKWRIPLSRSAYLEPGFKSMFERTYTAAALRDSPGYEIEGTAWYEDVFSKNGDTLVYEISMRKRP